MHVTALSHVPPSPAETAAESARWARRGLLGRLVRLEGPLIATEQLPARGARP
jgi:hypothetical protein